MSPSTIETIAAAKRQLLLHFAMLDRVHEAQKWGDIVVDELLKQRATSGGTEAEPRTVNASTPEALHFLDAEDERLIKLEKATDAQLLNAARENMKGFDHTAPIQPPSVQLLATIDPEIRSSKTPEEFFKSFRQRSLIAQCHVMGKLLTASREHADIHEFTRILFECLRRSNSYEPSVHGKLQREIFRVNKPHLKKGRPTSSGNYMLRRLIDQVMQEHKMPKRTAAKIVQKVMIDVLLPVSDADGKTVRYGFNPTDSAIKNIIEKQ